MELRRTLIALVILFALLAVFYLAGFKVPAFNQPEEELPDFSAQVGAAIEAGKSFEGGTHTYSGLIDKPTPCYLLETEALVRESFPEQVTLHFTLRPPKPDIICVQVETSAPFKIIFDASEEARVNATLNGRPIELKISESEATSTEELMEE